MTREPNSTPTETPRSWGAVALCLVFAAAFIALDLGSKNWASEHLSRARFGNSAPACRPDESGYISSVRVSMPPKVIVENFFELRYAENCGAAFGFLNNTNSPWKKVLFYGAAVGCVIVLLTMFRQGRGSRLFVVAVPTIIAGAIGNFTDRMRLGYVVDFFRFFHQAWEYPTFNVADIAITVGVSALVIDGIREEIRARRRSKSERSSGEIPVGTRPHDDANDVDDAPSAESSDANVDVIAEPASSESTERTEPVERSAETLGETTPELVGS